MKLKYTFSIVLLFFIIIKINAQDIGGSLEHDGATRNYTLHIPPGYSPGMSLPLVINMHGLGSSASQQAFYTTFNFVADTANFLVVYPQGLEATLNGQTATHWNADFGTGVDDVGFINKLIDVIYTEYNIDLERVYSTGMSNGGFMSYLLACQLSDRITAIASVTGAMPFPTSQNCVANRAVPVMQIHGTNDLTVPISGSPGFYPPISQTVDWWVDHNNCNMTPTETTVPDNDPSDGATAMFQHYTGGDENSEVIYYIIENGGHTWPGAFSVGSLGVTCQDFRASVRIWEFFLKHKHPNPAAGTIVSTKDIEVENIQISPNPFSDFIEISNVKEGSNILIKDISGKTIYNKTSYDGQPVSTKHFLPGVYFIIIKQNDSYITKKVVKF